MTRNLPHFNTIRNKMIVFFLISSLVPFLLLSGLSWSNYQKNINNNTLSYAKQLLSVSSGQLNDFFYRLNHYYYSIYTAGLASHISALGTKNAEEVRSKLSLNQQLQELQIFYSFPSDFYVTIANESGKILYHNGILYSPDTSLTESLWFCDYVQSSQQSALFPSAASASAKSEQSNYLSYTQKITAPEFQGQGYIFLIDFDTAYLNSLLDPLVLGSDSEIFLIWNQQAVHAVNADKISYQDVAALLPNSGDSDFFNFELNSLDYLIGMNTLSSSPISVLSLNRLDSVFKDTPNLAFFTVILSFISMSISVLFAIYFSGKLTRPIHILKEAANQVARKNLDVDIPRLTNDEIGELGISIDQMLKHIQMLIKEKYEYRLREKELQIKTLQAQIHPHFLYNTLETISSIAESEGIDDVSTIALNLADLYRYSISSSDKLVTISEELLNLQNYLSIMQIRFPDLLETEFSIANQAEKVPIMKLTLQPLIENAIQHGLKDIRTKGRISVCIQMKNEHVQITISDNGAGIPEAQLETLNRQLQSEAFSDVVKKTSHIGIVNVNYRLKLRFGDQCHMRIESTLGEGTSVIILLPPP